MTNILEHLEKCALERPNKVAVLDPATSSTYSELVQNAKRIGSALITISPPRQPIAVCMEKSVDTLTALIGIVYAGCFYVFIDPRQAPARIKQILGVCHPICILTDCPKRLFEMKLENNIFRTSDLLHNEINHKALSLVRQQSLDVDPLYCNFTSGTSGVPKGVLISHRSVIDFIKIFPSMFDITENDVIGNQAPFDFDVSVKDIFSSFKTGATLVLIPKKYFTVVTQLLDYLCEQKVTTLIWAVSALCLVTQFRGLSYKVPTTVNKILFSGELMPIKYLLQWQKVLPDAVFINLYGPTEITCNCTYYRINRMFSLEEHIPIGTAFPNEKVFLLDAQDREITEPDIRGEICVSGTALALGYYNNNEQTEKSFVQNPLNKSYPERIYRTGDLAIYNEDGELCFAGRKDFQIKYMGHRIELEEIESAMNNLNGVKRACCCFDAERKRIVAFYSGKIESRQLKKSLYPLIPEYMIPSEFHIMDDLPLTFNGKIDRKQLMMYTEEFRNG